MTGHAYVGTAKRTFRHALIRLLETNYGLIGSRRVLELLAQDAEQLVEEFYPSPQRLKGGWMVFTGTKAKGKKSRPGQTVDEYELCTLPWPVLLHEDLERLAIIPETNKARRKWFRDRLVRLVEYGWDYPDGPVLLTVADLAAMTGLTTVQVSLLLKQARKETGKPLLTKGYYFDQGVRPTHKREIIGLYEQGLDESLIAKRSGHAIQSVGRYIRDYERVKLLMSHGMAAKEIEPLLNMRPSVAKVNVEMAQSYHPRMGRVHQTT
jgi:hypothetical protein